MTGSLSWVVTGAIVVGGTLRAVEQGVLWNREPQGATPLPFQLTYAGGLQSMGARVELSGHTPEENGVELISGASRGILYGAVMAAQRQPGLLIRGPGL
ncbi:hypothetical protein AAFF_G00274590 [Aldrovandia affinis]|uniref:Uncharacterized protein n=1 Tax=Aldrovandia affinis TaxID=143900 RepID=A0AAD7SSZ9_9TELE|nr:hypothetical protein AAFF_G00274590 [Aldrovandia affinis]